MKTISQSKNISSHCALVFHMCLSFTHSTNILDEAIKGYRISNHVIWEYYNVGLVSCVRECRALSACASINYHVTHYHCQLNSADSGTITPTAAADFMYIDLTPVVLNDADNKVGKYPPPPPPLSPECDEISQSTIIYFGHLVSSYLGLSCVLLLESSLIADLIKILRTLNIKRDFY